MPIIRRDYYKGKPLNWKQENFLREQELAIWKDSPHKDDMNEKGFTWVGIAGEDLMEAWLQRQKLPYRRVSEQRLGHDFVVGDHLIDVKIKQRTVYPKAHFECAVSLPQLENRHCTTYVFGSYDTLRHVPVLVGWIPKNIFLTSPLSVPRKKGDRILQTVLRDGTHQMYTVLRDCKEMAIHDIRTLKVLKEELSKKKDKQDNLF